MNKIKRLFFDIETSPNIGLFWTSGYKLNISHDDIIKERAIICVCYKWAGEDKIYSLHWDTDQNDKTLLEKFIKVANEADELIGHNSDRFDIKWIRTRCMFYRLPMFPKYNSFDTLKFFRGYTNQPSNRLDDIGDYFGIGRKIKNEDGLWQKVIENNDRKALKRMVNY